MPNTATTNAIFLLAAAIGASTAPAAGAAEPIPCQPERWADAIAKFQKEDEAAPPPKQGILFVGSSSIRGWDLKKWFPDLPAINRGFGGSQLCDSTHYADALITKHQPRVIVVYAGDNDISAGKSPEQVHADFRALVAKIRTSLPETPIVFISIKPSLARWKLAEEMKAANRLIAADCEKEKNLKFVDVWEAMLGADGQPRAELLRDDRLHLTDAGYELWTELLRPAIVEE